MNFKDKINIYMEQNKIENLKQFAYRSKIPYTTLRDCYEKDSADNSRLNTIKKISKFMNCTTDYLAYEEVESPNKTLPEVLVDKFPSNKEENEYDDKLKKLATDNGVEISYSKSAPLTEEDFAQVSKILLEEIQKEEKK